MSICNTDSSGWEFGPLVVKPRDARRMLACGTTRLYELIATGELESFLDGRSRKITVESIRCYITQRLPRIREPQTRRRGRPRKVPATAGARAHEL